MAVSNDQHIDPQLWPHHLQRRFRHQQQHGSQNQQIRPQLSWLTILAVCCSLLHITSAHVALTYPPARQYDLDFLDNARTKGPCGMPKGSIKTSLLAGSTFNVTWHLAYVHKNAKCASAPMELKPTRCGSPTAPNSYCFVQYNGKVIQRGCSRSVVEQEACKENPDCMLCLAGDIRVCNTANFKPGSLSLERIQL